MRRIVIHAISLVVVVWFVSTSAGLGLHSAISFWQSRDSNYNISVGKAPYVGPGDVVSSAVAWWGLRAYSAAYAASLGVIANVCTPLDAVCADVSSDANGNFNLAGAATLLCNNTSSICTVKKLYDQTLSGLCSGSCDLENGTIGSRPTLVVPGAANGCTSVAAYCMAFASGNVLEVNASLTSAISVPATMTAVAIRTASFVAYSGILGNASGNEALYFYNANDITLYWGGNNILTGVNDSAWHAMQGIAAASGSVNADGLTAAVSASSQISGQLEIGNVGGEPLTGNISEIGLWAAGFTSGQISSMNSNQHGYWGF